MKLDPLTWLAVSCRRIFLKDHVVSMHIGVYDSEKITSQRVSFNVEIFIPYVASEASSDNLAEVVDYDFLREVIAKRIEVGHVELQETLCDDLANRILQHPHVQAVRLSSCKLDVYADSAGVGVEIFKLRDSCYQACNLGNLERFGSHVKIEL